jgi:hypothetical protein
MIRAMFPTDLMGNILGLLGVIALSILASLFTSPVKNWIARLSVARARKRVRGLERERELVAHYRDNPLKLIIHLVAVTLTVMVLFFFGLIMLFLSTEIILQYRDQSGNVPMGRFIYAMVFRYLGYGAFFLCVYSAGHDGSGLARRVLTFAEFLSETERAIARLQAIADDGETDTANDDDRVTGNHG